MLTMQFIKKHDNTFYYQLFTQFFSIRQLPGKTKLKSRFIYYMRITE